MNNRISRLLVGSVFSLTALAGCSTRSDFTAISGKNVNISDLRIEPKMAKGRTSGEDCMHMVLFFPNKMFPTLDEALDKAMEAKQANLLLDAVVQWNFFIVPLLYAQECWKVEGVAYDTLNK
ncbi:MAG: hypothetical protein ACU83V_03890 [Gammaproteobacteria bacterium]